MNVTCGQDGVSGLTPLLMRLVMHQVGCAQPAVALGIVRGSQAADGTIKYKPLRSKDGPDLNLLRATSRQRSRPSVQKLEYNIYRFLTRPD